VATTFDSIISVLKFAYLHTVGELRFNQGSHASWKVLEKYPSKSYIFLVVQMENKQQAVAHKNCQKLIE